MKRDLISINDLSVKDIENIFILADGIKEKGKDYGCPLIGKSIALVFQKPSMRTRVSFEVGIYQLGGNSIYFGSEETGIGDREDIRDIARVLSRYVDGLILRTFSHNDIVRCAEFASIPVINGLSDLEHPCQVLSDLYTIKEKFGRVNGVTIGYIGDGNNVCNSLIYGCGKLGIKLNIATPKGYEPRVLYNNRAQNIILTHSPEKAAKDADILYTDVWASMGQEKEIDKRRKAFRGYSIDNRLLKMAQKNCLVMHCLPAHRGEEITDEIVEGRHSIVFDQAENRLHIGKAILVWLLT